MMLAQVSTIPFGSSVPSFHCPGIILNKFHFYLNDAVGRLSILHWLFQWLCFALRPLISHWLLRVVCRLLISHWLFLVYRVWDLYDILKGAHRQGLINYSNNSISMRGEATMTDCMTVDCSLSYLRRGYVFYRRHQSILSGEGVGSLL